MSKKLYEGRRKGCMKKFIHVIDESLEEILMVLMLAAMTLIMGCQVFSRYILGVSLSWSEEITRYLFIWSAFLSVSLCTRKCISIKVDQFIKMFPKRGKTIFKITNLTVEFAFFVYLIPFSFLYLKATIESGQVSPACGLPMYYVQSAPFFCFILTAFRIVQRWFGEWRILLGKEKKPLEEGDIASVSRRQSLKIRSMRMLQIWTNQVLQWERRTRCQQLLFLLFLPYVLSLQFRSLFHLEL